MITVFHRKEFDANLLFNGPVNLVFDPEQFREVAKVHTESLNEAWRLTNHVDEDWRTNLLVESQVEGVRSSMIGDVFLLQGEYFMVDLCGFKPMSRVKAV